MSAKDGEMFYSGFSGVTSDDVEALLAKDFNTQEQELVDGLIKSAEYHIASQCHRNFLLTEKSGETVVDVSYQETFDIEDQDYRLSNYPAKEVTKIIVDGDTMYEKGGESNIYTLGVDFWCFRDKVRFNSVPSATTAYQNLVIEYSIKSFYGDDIILAVKRWVSELFTSKEFGTRGVSQVNMAGVNVMFDTNTIPKYIQSVIDTYKRRFV